LHRQSCILLVRFRGFMAAGDGCISTGGWPLNLPRGSRD
jgi:hypothetical protein